MYRILGFQTEHEGCAAECKVDTLKAARRQAKYMLSDDFARVCEAPRNLAVAQIWKGKKLVTELRPRIKTSKIKTGDGHDTRS